MGSGVTPLEFVQLAGGDTALYFPPMDETLYVKTRLELVQSKWMLRIPSLSDCTVGACPPFPGPSVLELLQRPDVFLPPPVVLMEVPW